MASFEFDENALQNLMDKLEHNGLFDEDTQKELLTAGATVMRDNAEQKMRAAGHVDTGETEKHITVTRKVVTTKTGAKRLSVTVTGKDKRGERYAAKAFVLNYGRKKAYGYLPGSLFWTTARKISEPRIEALWRDMVTKKLKEKGLI